MIKLDEIGAGDEVTLQDRNRNLVVGVVSESKDGRAMQIEVFGHDVPFLRKALRRKPPHAEFWAEVPGVRVMGHLPAMF